jgi:hypothetical protein
MRSRSIALVALVGCTVLPLAANAQYQPAPAQAPVPRQRQYHIHDLHWVSAHVGTSVITLEKARGEYGGHRTAAVNFMRQAHEELRMAQEWGQAHGYQPMDLGVEPARANPEGVQSAKQVADKGLFNAQRHTPEWIAMLQRDTRDYGGHRQAAIDALQRADGELNAALAAGQ